MADGREHTWRTRQPTLILRILAAAVTASALLIPGILPVSRPPVASAQPLPTDGLSMQTAAASCWEIKQADPAASDGLYWLVTPLLQRPEQFYCDMTTDGGGWVLIGRGREGWRGQYEGLGTTAEVRDEVSGPGAFRTRQLHSRIVDGLLNGGRVDALPEGIRLRRARDAAGTTWQETRFKMTDRPRWVWTFRAGHPIRAVTFDGITGAMGSSKSFGIDDAFLRVNTDTSQAQGWTGGWAYGSTVAGTPDSDSYLWSKSAGVGWARPFTQVFVRPRLLSSTLTYPALPETGMPAQTLSRLAENRAVPTTWGVAGLASNGGVSSEMRTEVQALAQVGGRMFVGGNFRDVQRDEAGTGRVTQSYLAAFDVNSGAFIDSFRPTFNNQIKSLTALPDGRLAVGGEFTVVNGQASPGVAILDPMTGSRAGPWQLSVENRLTGGLLSVRALTVADGWLYLGGALTHLSGGGSSAVYARSAARVALTNGRPDATWNPALNGTVTDISPSADGSVVYAVGYFTTSGSSPANRMAALATTPVGTADGWAVPLAPWIPKFSIPASQPATFQFTVAEAGGRVWVGGAQHSLFSYLKDATGTLAFSYGGLALSGGDFQTSVVDGDVLYAGCHCADYFFSKPTDFVSTSSWPRVFDQADALGFIGAWHAPTARYLPDFDPLIRTRAGYGAWASAVDSTGTLWVGGSIEKSVAAPERTQWSGGFARFAARDTVAPTPPGPLTVGGDSVGLTLSWTGSLQPDEEYEVLREGKVIAALRTTSLAVASPDSPTRFAVRVADQAGNRSASSVPVTVDPAELPQASVLLAARSSWAWRYDNDPLDVGWIQPGFDDSAWPRGPAVLGFGAPGLGTVITAPAAATVIPLAAQYRTTFSVTDPSAFDRVRVTVKANDGVIVYLNGQEIGRKNLPDGPIGQNSYATAAPTSSTAATAPLVITLPGPGGLVPGLNTITAQSQQNYRSTPDLEFDAELVGVDDP